MVYSEPSLNMLFFFQFQPNLMLIPCLFFQFKNLVIVVIIEAAQQYPNLVKTVAKYIVFFNEIAYRNRR